MSENNMPMTEEEKKKKKKKPEDDKGGLLGGIYKLLPKSLKAYTGGGSIKTGGGMPEEY